MAYRAKLDNDGIYWGIEEIAAAGAGDVEIPQDCDLKPGAYRWNKKDATFDPLPPSQVRSSADTVDFERAVYELCEGLDAAGGKPLPALTVTWCKQYETSFDGDMGRKLSYFRDKEKA